MFPHTGSKEAVTVVSRLMRIKHVVPRVVSHPVHALNAEALEAVAVRLIERPFPNASLQSAPQLMPEGEDVTVPRPCPDTKTVSCLGTGANTAVIVRSDVRLTVQSTPVTTSHPDQLPKSAPTSGVAVSTTRAP